MSRILELPEPVYDALCRAAEASGTTPVEWLTARLPQQSDSPPAAKTMADLFAGRIGRIAGTSREALSEDCGKRYADDLEAKHREGSAVSLSTPASVEPYTEEERKRHDALSAGIDWQKVAARSKPPQSWFDETDDPFAIPPEEGTR